MAFRDVKQFPVDDNLFEPVQPTQTVRANPLVDTLPRFAGFLHYPVALLSFATGAKLVVAVIMVILGIVLGGSYFGPAAGKFGGMLATVFYQWQIGTILIIAGMILAYDTLRSRS